MPPPKARANARLLICMNFARSGTCRDGTECTFVHADITDLPLRRPHINYAWPCLSCVEYERYPPGQLRRVALPNSREEFNDFPSDALLKTRALESGRRLAHCAHYFFNRWCHRGAECEFVHAVFIDPAAPPHRLAPAPSQIADEHQRVLSLRQRLQPRPSVPPGSSREAPRGRTWRHNPYRSFGPFLTFVYQTHTNTNTVFQE